MSIKKSAKKPKRVYCDWGEHYVDPEDAIDFRKKRRKNAKKYKKGFSPMVSIVQKESTINARKHMF